MSKLRVALVCLASFCLAPGIALSQQRPAGHALWVFGQVERVGADQAVRPLAKGDAVFEGDTIRSGPGSQAQLVMSDQALIAIRAQSSLKLDAYSYGEGSAERAVIDLLKGGLRSVTGAIGRNNKENYRLKNDTHVIGIRGTDHEAFVTADGTFDRVSVGGTYLQSPAGRIDLGPGEVGFASRVPEAAPMRLERTPEFMQVAALGNGYAGPRPRGPEASDERRLQQSAPGAGQARAAAAAPVLPSRALGENSSKSGFGAGGRCDGPCSDPIKNKNKVK
jgi:hypothetical protein